MAANFLGLGPRRRVLLLMASILLFNMPFSKAMAKQAYNSSTQKPDQEPKKTLEPKECKDCEQPDTLMLREAQQEKKKIAQQETTMDLAQNGENRARINQLENAFKKSRKDLETKDDKTKNRSHACSHKRLLPSVPAIIWILGVLLPIELGPPPKSHSYLTTPGIALEQISHETFHSSRCHLRHALQKYYWYKCLYTVIS